MSPSFHLAGICPQILIDSNISQYSDCKVLEIRSMSVLEFIEFKKWMSFCHSKIIWKLKCLSFKLILKTLKNHTKNIWNISNIPNIWIVKFEIKGSYLMSNIYYFLETEFQWNIYLVLNIRFMEINLASPLHFIYCMKVSKLHEKI